MVRLAFEAAKGSSLAVVREQENSASQTKNDIENYRAELKKESDRLLKEVASRGDDTVARTKKQVRDIVLENAKSEFASSRKWLWVQVAIWSVLSIVCIVAFFAYCFRVASEQHLPESWTWQIAYYTGIRVLIIAAIGAIISFCLRMLKGHIQLVHINAHRSRLVNSIADFVEAAPGDKQFEIFRILIDTVVTNGPTSFSDTNSEAIAASGKIAEQLVARVVSKE